MATLDRLREIVKSHRGSVPAVDATASPSESARQVALPASVSPCDPADYTRATLELGGALVEHADGAVIVVDREYTADARHGQPDARLRA
jgi:hypothetical protein